MTEVRWSGPHHHEGAGAVSQDVKGLEKDNTYFVKVLVDTVAGSVESNSYPFGEGFLNCLVDQHKFRKLTLFS